MDALDIAASNNQFYTPGNTYDLTIPGTTQVIANPQPYIEPDTISKTNAIFQGVAGIIGSLGQVYSQLRYAPYPTYGSPARYGVPGAQPYLPPTYATFGGSGQITLQTLLPWILIGGVAYLLFKHR